MSEIKGMISASGIELTADVIREMAKATPPGQKFWAYLEGPPVEDWEVREAERLLTGQEP